MNCKKSLKKDYTKITDYYEKLVLLTKKKYFVGPTNEWFIDNYYLLREVYNHFQEVKRDRKFINIINNATKVEKMLSKILKRYNYLIDINILQKEINRFQQNYEHYFSYNEIDTIVYILFVLFFKRLSLVVDIEETRLQELLKADKVTDTMVSKHYKNNAKIDIKNYIKLNKTLLKKTYYLYRLNEKIQELGSISDNGFMEFNELLKENNVDIRTIIEQEHKKEIENNIVTSNIFQSLKIVLELDSSTLYDKVSFTEKQLNFDEVYKNMTDDTKSLYREQIIKNQEEELTDEYSYVNRLITEALKTKTHIGNYLFKEKNLKGRRIFYLGFITIVTLILTLAFAILLFQNYIFGFFLLLLPCSDIVIKITNKLLLQFYKPVSLPKMNYLEKIPNSAKTMMVIPTIVKDKKKMLKMFKKLEQFYLVNNSKNLYFALMVDASEEKSKTTSFDDEICNYGLELCKELNKKYKQNLFYFVYRNRFYNKSMHSYLGYERKRGALIDFNKLLLHQYTNEQKEKYFKVETISSLNEKIKYVITLDADTDLVLNTAIHLIGAMDHPLNKPIYNEEKTKIIKGYGMMQPRISMDIESTNKSIYSQTFAGVGGFSVYNSTVSDFYQDYFHEGNFVGKGIYNLEAFDTILSNLFPENLILSHDMIEGIFLRCALASDIEFIDDFPASYQVDTTRQARWARGDTQILGYLKSKIKAGNKWIKNPIDSIGKFRIFDNIRRMFLYLAFVLLLVLNTCLSKNLYFTILFLLFVLLLPTLLSWAERIHIQIKPTNRKQKYKYHENIMYGNKAVAIRSFISFITIPYTCYLYLKSFFTSVYRMLISKQNLLSWLTAEDAEKKAKNTLSTYFKKFIANYICVIVLLVVTLLTDPSFFLLPTLFSLSFLIAPFVLNYVSKTKTKKEEINDEKNKEITELAHLTWQYFDQLLTKEYNYLIPDNYQLTREEKVDLKTSPTNIGFSLTSIISAYELNFISLDKAINLIHKIIKTVQKLEKWNGHLYNWYDIKTLEIKEPQVVSSVDSGNFVACLIVTKEFVKKHKEKKLYEMVKDLIQNTNFKVLYTNKNVFSVVYDTKEAKLSEYNYNKFASESRLLGYVAIALQQVPIKHWLSLDKTQTRYKRHKGLLSWSGTSFEYYMPLIFMKNYKNTLLDESYYFAYFCQKEYALNISKNLPWGISESACAKKDEKMNYKYRYFSTPYLKLQNDMDDRVVISPYSSLMTTALFPEAVYENIKKFKEMGMYGEYGCYEAYDYDLNENVYAFFAHHQGMILSSLANYLKDGIIQNYFHSDTNMNAYDMLLKEKLGINTPIDISANEYKKYNFEREKVANDFRSFSTLKDTKEFSVLSNGKYALIINDRGNGFSRYKEIQINRYRKITNQDYGTYLYIRDLKTNKIWSNTYAPVYKTPDKYEVVFATDRVKFIREDENFVTKSEMIVTKKHNAEIRKYTFMNNSHETKNIEITSYNEVVLDKNMADINHRTFQNLFIHSEIDTDNDALVMCRKNRNDFSLTYCFARLLNLNSNNPSTFVSEREEFINRGNNLTHPAALFQKLSNKVGTNIDPIMAIRHTLKILPGQKQEVYYISGFARSKEEVNDILKSYNEKHELEEAFTYATMANNENTKLLGLEGYEMRTYNTMLNYIYQTSKIFIHEDRVQLLKQNSLNQTNLWKFGISGDLPIMCIHIEEISSLGFVREILKAYLYFKSRSIFLDLVIINSEDEEYSKVIKKEIELELYKMRTLYDIDDVPGRVFILDKKDVSKEEETLLNMTARLKFDTKVNKSLADSVLEISKQSNMAPEKPIEYERTFPSSFDCKKLKFYNGYGGFSKQGKEYIITNENTKTPWTNVLSNKTFGTIMTNNMCGFTYGYNSQMYKISTWTNDIVVNDRTEGIQINQKYLNPSLTKFGAGYVQYIMNTKDYIVDSTIVVAKEDNIKIYKLKITNRTDKKLNLQVSLFLNPTLGSASEKTNRYILCEKSEQYLYMRNVYDPNFSDVTVFLASSEKIDTFDMNQVTKKSITSTISIEKDSSYELSFVLGCAKGMDMVDYLATKYHDLKVVNKEIKSVIQYWEKRLSKITVKTPDESFDYMMNSWYLYQTLSSRLQARAGFYQVGGAFGYRDQLQDATNICSVYPEITKEQILINARHQFEEGDVLHWWHTINHFGLRSRYKDDYLWLVYATATYLNITEDYSILDEQVPFVQARKLEENEEESGMNYSYTEHKKSLYEHLKLSIDHALANMAENGLPLIGGGDWNDGMNKVGIEGKGSSVWLGFFLYDNIQKFILLSKNYDLNLNMNAYQKELEKLEKALNRCYQDGYYLRAFFDDGTKLGAKKNKECKIDLISQAFAILTGLSKEKTDSVVEAVEKNLVDENLKIIKLLTPSFSGKEKNPGYIAGYPEGIRENGGQYTHATAWYILALLKIGKYKEAYEYYQMINPIHRSDTQEKADVYKIDPYVISADIYSNKDMPARGGWNWYTGSSGWYYNVGLNHILGFRLRGNHLEIKPQNTFKEYEIIYHYNDTIYKIAVKKDTKNEIKMDNQKVREIELIDDKKPHQIEVFVKE